MTCVKKILILGMICSLLASCAPEASLPGETQPQSPVETAEVPAGNEPAARTEPVDEISTEALEDPTLTPTENVSSEETEAATPTPSDAEPDLIRLSLEEPSTEMEILVQRLHAEEMVSTTEGTYFQMNDLILRWAQINWYKAWFSPIAPDDFVITSNVRWFAASKNANTFNSGCGFAFHAEDRHNHYMAFIATDGYVYLWRVYNGRPSVLARGWYNFYSAGQKNEEGIWVSEAIISLVVEGSRFSFFVEDEPMWTYHDPVLEEGHLAMALASGINTGFGTQCEFRQTEIFVLDNAVEGD